MCNWKEICKHKLTTKIYMSRSWVWINTCYCSTQSIGAMTWVLPSPYIIHLIIHVYPLIRLQKKTFIHSFPLVNWTVPLAFSITLTFIPRPLSAAPPPPDVSDPQETDPSSPPCPTSFSQPPSPLPCPTPFTQPPCANSYLTHSVPCPTPDVNVQVFRTILVRQYKHWGIWKTVITFTL